MELTEQISDQDVSSDLSDHKINALSAVKFKIVYNVKDLANNDERYTFYPDMAHQVFGESELIFGYKSVHIDLFYMHNSFKCYRRMKTSGKLDMDVTDDINDLLNPWLPSQYVKKEMDFVEVCGSENHDQMFGTTIHEFKQTTDSILVPNAKLPCTYKINICDRNDPEFRETHERFETFIIWYIDGANFLDLDDERWIIFYIYEEFEHPVSKQIYRSPIGFCTLYKFFAYPENIRARISQFFILPTLKRRGLGSEFYKAICQHLRTLPEVVDITVEQPVQSFQNLRDICDCLYVKNHLKKNQQTLVNKNQKRILEYMREHKICKRQGQRIIDILKYLAAIKAGATEYESFVTSIQERMKNELEREHRIRKRVNVSTEIKATPVDESAASKCTLYLAELNVVVSKLKNFVD